MAVIIRADTGKSLTTDGVTGETYTPSAAVTAHPVEDGTTIADHVQRLPYTYSLTALWTPTPAPERAGDLPTGADRIYTVKQFIEELFNTPTTVDIYTAKGDVLLNAVLTRATYPTPTHTGLVVTLEFQEVLIVSGQAVNLPKLSAPAKAAGVAPVADMGASSATTPTEPEKANYTSALSKVFGLGG